jgi:hypothetical protein
MLDTYSENFAWMGMIALSYRKSLEGAMDWKAVSTKKMAQFTLVYNKCYFRLGDPHGFNLAEVAVVDISTLQELGLKVVGEMNDKTANLPEFDCGISSFILAHPVKDEVNGVHGYVPFRREIVWIMTMRRAPTAAAPKVSLANLMVDHNMRIWRSRVMRVMNIPEGLFS